MFATSADTVRGVTSTEATTIATNAGMLALWRTSAFAEIDRFDDWERRYDAWERRVNERLDQAIRSGELVPVGIQSDGAFGIRVVVAPDVATEREARYTVATSEPYLLVADGGAICLSGIEVVGDAGASPVTLTLPEGRYSVRSSLIAWDEEPGAFGPDARPSPDALPDFLVEVTASNGHEIFRTDEVTFDPPGSAGDAPA